MSDSYWAMFRTKLVKTLATYGMLITGATLVSSCSIVDVDEELVWINVTVHNNTGTEDVEICGSVPYLLVCIPVLRDHSAVFQAAVGKTYTAYGRTTDKRYSTEEFYRDGDEWYVD